MEVFVEGGRDHQDPFRLSHKREIDVREYLFSDVEIQEDWRTYQKIIDIKKVLRPNTIFASGISLDDEEDSIAEEGKNAGEEERLHPELMLNGALLTEGGAL